jgi:hypothetical protein
MKTGDVLVQQLSLHLPFVWTCGGTCIGHLINGFMLDFSSYLRTPAFCQILISGGKAFVVNVESECWFTRSSFVCCLVYQEALSCLSLNVFAVSPELTSSSLFP